MVPRNIKMSPQYLREGQISITILEVKSPTHYVVKESPSINISSEAKTFVEAEEMMQKYYHSIEATFFQLPLKDSIVVVYKYKKFFRAQVCSIMTMSEGHLIKVYLLDYGLQCTVPRTCLFQIEKDFLLHPFQAIEFKLSNVTPISLLLNSDDLGIQHGVVDVWDSSAVTFIEKLREGMIDTHIVVNGVGQNFLTGSLYMMFADNEIKCVNDELVLKKYAQYNTDCWNNVTKINDILSKLPKQCSGVPQNSNSPTSSPSGLSQSPPPALVIKEPNFSKLPAQFKNIFQSRISPTSLPKSSPQVSPNSLVVKETVSPKSPGQYKNVPLGDMSTSFQTSPNTVVIKETVSPKLSGQYINPSLGPTSLQKSCSRTSPNSQVIEETVLSKLPGQHKSSLGFNTPTSLTSNSCQASSDSLIREENKPNESVKRLQNLLKLRDDRESKVVQAIVIKENKNKETENAAVVNVETKDKRTESQQISCEDTNANKKQLQMLLKYRKLKSSKSAISPQKASNSSPEKDVEIQKLSPNSTLSSTSSDIYCDTSPPKNSNMPNMMQTPVRETNLSTSNNKLSMVSPQKNHNLSTPKLKIVLEKPINRCSKETENQNVPSESSTKICMDQQSTQEACLLKSPPKASEKFQDIKKFLYRKRNSSSVSFQTHQSDTKTVKDTVNFSELKNDANMCHDPSTENEKDSAKVLLPESGFMGDLPESGFMQDLPESLKMFKDMDFDDEDDLLQCVLCPRRKESSPSSNSPKSSSNTNSCSEYFQVDFSNKSLWEKQKVPALCLGTAVPKPVLSTSAMSFPPDLRKILEDVNFCGPSCIQSVVWPAVERGRSLAAIAPPHSGKTVAYLLPIVSNFLHKTASGDIPEGNGPVVIIICSTWKKVQALYDLLHIFLRGVTIRILTFFVDGRKKPKRIATLLNGCDILISVPSCLLEFFKEHVICVSRCLHFVLDDGSNLFTHCMNEIKQIMACFVAEAKSAALKNLEFIICAERWTKSVVSFVDKFMTSPLLLFTSFLEAAIYAKVPIIPCVCEEADKRIKLLGILENAKKTIICTTNSERASEIHSFLQCENVRSYLVTEEQEHYISDGFIQDWKFVNSSAVPHCLIVTDAALSNMSISNANCLIHYDVPEVSRLQFGNRFSCIAEHFPNLAENLGCVCHVLISGECTTQAPSLMKIIRRCGVEIPKELKDLASKVVIKNADSSLCHYYKAFGSCKLTNCRYRHHIDPITDKPTAIINEGDIQGLVTHIFDASHFYIRILKHLPPNAHDLACMSGSYAKIGFQLRNFYSSESNRVKVECPIVGQCYVLQEENTLFFRVKVLNIIPAMSSERQKIELFFQDEGWIRVYDNYQLFKLEESIQLPPPQAVEVYLCGICTPDSSFEWNPQANRCITDLIKDKEIHGKIALCLGETLWIHPVILREKLLFSNDYVNLLTLDRALIDGGYALNNKDHLPSLIQACAENVPLPKTIGRKITEYQNLTPDQPAVGYAFLEINAYEDVYVSSVISPQQVYVQRAKFVDCLDNLLDNINALISEKALKKCKSLQKGMHCIAPFSEDNRFYRALVTDIASNGDGARVFFVDFGDSQKVEKDLMYVLPPELLLLPFQAIECELNGICAPHGGWTDKTVDTLHDLTRDDAGDMKILQLMSYSKSCCYEGGYHYVIDLWNSEKTISEQLLEAGLVSPAEKATPVVPQDEIWDEEEIFEDIPEGYIVSSEEDLDPDDKDHHALFCAALAKLMLQGSEKVSDSATIVPTTSTEGEKSSHGQAKGGKEIQSNKVEEVIEIMPATMQSPLQALQKLMNFTKSKKEQKSAKPFITWWDTMEQLNVLINLRDIQVYELDLSDDGFKFETLLRGMNYYSEEHFYSQVCSENGKILNTPEGLNIILNKQKAERWPRFSKEVTKLFHIKYDFNHIDDSGTDEIAEGEVPVPGNQIDKSEIVSHLSEDEISSNSDEDESYVQPWKKLAEYKDPFSPLH